MSRIRADRYTNRAGTGAPTFSEGVNVVGVTSMSGDLAVTNGTITGPSQLTISGITSSISDTAVDVFVYDTSKDSDGGDWRKRTQNTSWYNETLNTATRGSRKEFPAVAVIVAESDKVTIYDGDDPDLPMWMVLNADSSDPTKYAIVRSVGKTISSLYALNGIICDPVSFNGLFYQNFVEDACYRVNTTNTIFGGSIVNRNGGMNFALNVTSSGLISSTVNDVAMTVLPNAPVDSATGLPVPTIAVATASGTSVIKDDGSVADLTGFNPVTTVHIDEDSVIATSNSGTPSHDFIFKTNIPSSDEAFNAGITAGSYNYYMNSSSGTTPLLRDIDMTSSAYNSKDDIAYRGGTGGVDYINAAAAISNISTTSAIAYISKDYNTGYMKGDIKLATLSDTNATNQTGGTVADRSVNNNAVNVTGTITRTAVATGADLVGYSGFSASNYLQQPYNSDLAPGTSPYSVVAWFKTGSTSSDQYIFDRSADGSPRNLLLVRGTSSSPANVLQFYHVDASGNQSDLIASDFTVADDVWHHVVALCDGSAYRVYVDGAASATINSTIRDVDNTDTPPLYFGVRYSLVSPMTGNIALFRWSSTAPSAEQVKKMYEDEKYLFQENSQATLYGSSDVVTALAYDDTTDLLHVGTSAGRSEFQGLRRINNTTVGITSAISASNELVAEQ